MTQPLVSWLLMATWTDFKNLRGGKMEARIDILSFAFDLTSAAVANLEDEEVRKKLELELNKLEVQINTLRYNYEMILDFPSLHDGDMHEIDEKHNQMEEDLSMVVQKLLALQIQGEMVDSKTAREFYMSRRMSSNDADE